jgi:uncharacterized protein
MSGQLKNYLATSIIGTLIVFAFCLLWFVASYSKNTHPTSFRSFQVSAQGSATTIPDIAKFSFEVVTQGGIDLTATQEQNTQNTNSAIAFLKQQGIEQKDIATKNYSVEPRYQYYNCSGGNRICPPPDIVGYTVVQQVHVKVRDFTLLGSLLSGVVQKGANTLSQLSFDIDDATQIENEARQEAIKKAKEKAYAVADAAKFKVGRLLSIQEGGGSFPRYDFVGSGSPQAQSSVPAIEPGSQDVNITVTLTYEIK